MSEKKEYEFHLYDYWRILRRRKGIILLALVLVEFFTILYTSRITPVYRASSSVEIERRVTETGFFAQFVTWYPGDIMSTESRIIRSRPVLEAVVFSLGLAGTNPSPEELDRQVDRLLTQTRVVREAVSNILNIEVTSQDPKEAAALANTIAHVYAEKSAEKKSERDALLRSFIEEQMEFARSKLEDSEEALRMYEQTGKITSVKASLESQLASLELKLSELRRNYTESHPEVKSTRQRIEDLRGLFGTVSRQELASVRLKREVTLNTELYTLLSKKYKDAMISEADRAANVHIINPATAPRSPVKPNKQMNYAMGILLGLFLGILVAIVRENLDTSIGTIEEVEDYLQVPVLAVIPRIGEDDKRKRTSHREKLIIFTEPKSPVAEAFRTLYTNIEMTEIEQPHKTVLFTSTSLQEGKSVVISNTALAAAQMGKRVLLLETDLRKPVVHNIFGIPREPGITNYLFGTASYSEILRGTTDFLLGSLDPQKVAQSWGIENLKVIPCGAIPPNPTEIFHSRKIANFLEKVKKDFDLILLDSAPVLPVADSAILATSVDCVVLVYKVGVTARGALRRAKLQLEQARGKVIGIILNDIRASEMMDTGYYYHYYHKYYSDETETPSGDSKKKEK